MLVRAARPADIAAMAQLSGQLGYPVDAVAFGERLAHLAARPENGIFVAELDGGVVGRIHVGGRILLESEPFAEILGLIVDEGFRQRGIGARLVAACLDWAGTHDWSTVRVRSNMIRVDAHRFYEGQGFSCSKNQSVFVRPIEREMIA